MKSNVSDIQNVVDAIRRVPLNQGRRIVAIAGPPASGKSTFAGQLQDRIPGACVLPMDGFHRDNADLAAQGLLARKGAPQTFDVAGLESLVLMLRVQQKISFPTFDRARDCVVLGGGEIRPSDHTILVEGNYLLLNHAPWDRLRLHWDMSITLDVPIATLRERLVKRWLKHGQDPKSALKRAESNDLPNARFIRAHEGPADLVVSLAN